MLQKMFSLLLLGSVAYSLPAADPAADAEPQLPLVHTYGAPLVYHAANCTVEEEVIMIQNCLPKTVNECEDIDVPSQKLEYITKCQNVTSTHCTNGLTTINAGEATKVKREAEADAEADPQLYGLAPIVPLLKHTCVETIQEHCFQEPLVTDISTTVKRCLVKTSVECTDVEHKIPKTVCAHEPISYFG
eukprot:GFUD01003090.1.p1 GENE.GFUD01003090.1~~GFUD01003090.1.p1  ORF type:complete len:189 (+),score=46.28 GFUD01003090.1:116-682(+)